MSPRGRGRGRTQKCGAADARAKLQRAEKFMEVSDLITDEASPDPDFTSAAAALAVLAGIAASDAACCKALGVRSRRSLAGTDHSRRDGRSERHEEAHQSQG